MGIIFTLLMKFIVSIVNFILLPINALVVNALPNFTDKINYFESLVGRFVSPTLAWFFNTLPPYTKSFIIFYLELLIILYTITIGVHLVLKVIHIIKNIKIW